MAKTRRKKINKRPLKIYPTSKVTVVENGMGVKVAGYRAEGKQVAAKGETAKAVEDFREQVVAAREVPKRIRAETQVLRDGINELLGNQPPSGS